MRPDSRYFSEFAFEKMTGKKVEGVSAKYGNKVIMILPEASHVGLYDDSDSVCSCCEVNKTSVCAFDNSENAVIIKIIRAFFIDCLFLFVLANIKQQTPSYDSRLTVFELQNHTFSNIFCVFTSKNNSS